MFLVVFVARTLPAMREGISNHLSARSVILIVLALLSSACVVSTAPTEIPTSTPTPIPILVGEFTLTGSPLSNRRQHSATLLNNGKVLIVGGTEYKLTESSYKSSQKSYLEVPLASAELYDPTSRGFIATDKMASPKGGHTATLLPNGKVLVIGAPVNAELYDPSTGTWTDTYLIDLRAAHTATLLKDGRVLVVGGRKIFGVATADAEIYDSSTNTWTLTNKMSSQRYDHAAVLLEDGSVLVTGGWGQDPSSAEIWDPKTQTWSTAGNMTGRRERHSATLLPDGKVLIVGGGSGHAELYDPKSGAWKFAGTTLHYSNHHTATPLPDGRVLVTWGIEAAGPPRCCGSAEIYDPGPNKWIMLPT